MRRPLPIVAAIALVTLAAHAERATLVVDPQRTRVTFTLRATAHTVEGGFETRSGEVVFDPASGEASGRIVVDLRSGATGNARRDRTMHEKVLETDAHPLAVLEVTRLKGALRLDGPSSLVVVGTLSFHGAGHSVEWPVDVVVEGTRVAAKGTFAVPYVAWGLHDPSVLFLRVAKDVTVRVELEGEISASPS